MVGVYWAARPYDAGPSELVQPGSFECHQQPASAVLSKAIWLGCIGLLDLTMPGLRSWSNPGRNKKVHFFVTTRVGPTPKARHRKVRVSPTTCLRGIVQGDMVGVYWAARPYDAGPSELVQPGSVRSQVRVSPTTCLRGIVQGDMVGVYWAARPYDAGPSELVQPGS
ncbi:hypothetical protein LXL04_038450 [Taraxacum kok-saghyz]